MFSFAKDEPIHFSTPARPEFYNELMNGSFKLVVDEKSIERFHLANNKQGFAAFVNIDPDNKNKENIYSLPTFNKGDGLPRCDRYGHSFDVFVEAPSALG